MLQRFDNLVLLYFQTVFFQLELLWIMIFIHILFQIKCICIVYICFMVNESVSDFPELNSLCRIDLCFISKIKYLTIGGMLRKILAKNYLYINFAKISCTIFLLLSFQKFKTVIFVTNHWYYFFLQSYAQRQEAVFH